MNEIIVSIIMPVYNCAEYVGKAIDSVLAQTFNQFELILIDDGSTDGSEEIVEQYKDKEERIKVVHIPNSGPSAARNVGIAKAQGKWIQFVDADDCFEPDMLMTFYKNSNDMDLVIGSVIQQYTRLNKKAALTLPYKKLESKGEIACYLKSMDEEKKALTLNYVWNRWIRKSVLDINQIRFDEELRLGEDFIFNCEVFKNISRTTMIQDALYHHYYRENATLSNCFVDKEAERRKRMHAQLCDLMKHYEVYKDVTDLIETNEGKYCWISLSKICLPDCNISRREKLEYIRALCTRENRKYMKQYFRKQPGMLNLAKRSVISCNSVGVLYVFLQVYSLKIKGIKIRRSS